MTSFFCLFGDRQHLQGQDRSVLNSLSLLDSMIFCHSFQRFVIIYFSVVFVSSQWVYDDDGCRTPNRGVGSCIPIRQCEPIINLINDSPKPLSLETTQILQSYRCGFSGNDVKVCCPKSPINVNQPSGNRRPPDVSNHRNMNLLPRNCGILSTDERIINGNKTGLFEFPWMALLSYRTQRGPDFRCGGTVLNNRYILTAAHCITNLNIPLIGVRVGEHDIRTNIDCETQQDGSVTCAPPVQDLAIEEVIPHPQYNKGQFSNDIGLVRVSPMNISIENVRPICLPVGAAKDYNFGTKNVIVTGWGATETGRSSPDLLKVEIPVVPQSTCQKIYEKQAPITYKQICAGGKNQRDSCGGDSGGPLQVVQVLFGDTRYIQQGIVSFGPRNCGLEGSPGVYTRVAYFMDWILDSLR